MATVRMMTKGDNIADLNSRIGKSHQFWSRALPNRTKELHQIPSQNLRLLPRRKMATMLMLLPKNHIRSPLRPRPWHHLHLASEGAHARRRALIRGLFAFRGVVFPVHAERCGRSREVVKKSPCNYFGRGPWVVVGPGVQLIHHPSQHADW